MNGELSLMYKQLQMTDRPWIKVDLEATSPLNFYQNNTMANFSFKIILNNIGRSVATNLNWNAKLYFLNPLDKFHDFFFDAIKQQQSVQCEGDVAKFVELLTKVRAVMQEVVELV